MTYEEAKRYILENWFDGEQDVKAVVLGDEETMALKMAVEAIEKQIPKKPKITLHGTTDYNTKCTCPSCGGFVCADKHCRNCGQSVDWGDTE